jgi:hypothetical protein
MRRFLQTKKIPPEGGISIGKICLRQHRGLLSKTWDNYIYLRGIGAWSEASTAWPGATISGRLGLEYAQGLIHQLSEPHSRHGKCR